MNSDGQFSNPGAQVLNFPVEGGPMMNDTNPGANPDSASFESTEEAFDGAVYLDEILEDDTFKVRPEGDLSLLATDLARLGQLFPIDVREVQPGKYQVIWGDGGCSNVDLL
jgi:hypothetical protein